MHRTTKTLALFVSLLFIFTACVSFPRTTEKTTISAKDEPSSDISKMNTPLVLEVMSPLIEEELMSIEDVELIALVTMAEAEGECEDGKRLVIDTILNRVDSEHFPDTVYDVIYQPNQFSPMWNGRVERCEVREDICQLVREELASRTDYNVMFFTAGRYSDYGVPMFQVENHYFSSYN